MKDDQAERQRPPADTDPPATHPPHQVTHPGPTGAHGGDNEGGNQRPEQRRVVRWPAMRGSQLVADRHGDGPCPTDRIGEDKEPYERSGIWPGAACYRPSDAAWSSGHSECPIVTAPVLDAWAEITGSSRRFAPETSTST